MTDTHATSSCGCDTAKRLDELCKRVETIADMLTTDSQRLDWLERTLVRVMPPSDSDPKWYVISEWGGGAEPLVVEGPSVRDAIDFARLLPEHVVARR